MTGWYRPAVFPAISAVNQWRLDEKLRHFIAELSLSITGTSSPLISPSGTAPDILRMSGELETRQYFSGNKVIRITGGLIVYMQI